MKHLSTIALFILFLCKVCVTYAQPTYPNSNGNTYNNGANAHNSGGSTVGSDMQQRQKQKLSAGLQAILQTQFMVKFMDTRTQAEVMMKSFKGNSNRYPSSQSDRIRIGYDNVARRFNLLLDEVKMDLMNKEKLKIITQYPQMYSDGMSLKLHQLMEYYQGEFQQPLRDLTNNQVDGSPIVLLLMELLTVVKPFVEQYVQALRESKLFTESYLQENFVKPNRFPLWDDVLAGAASTYSPSQNGGNNNGSYPTTTGNTGTQNGGNNGGTSAQNDPNTSENPQNGTTNYPYPTNPPGANTTNGQGTTYPIPTPTTPTNNAPNGSKQTNTSNTAPTWNPDGSPK
jgi:hypothetical protein